MNIDMSLGVIKDFLKNFSDKEDEVLAAQKLLTECEDLESRLSEYDQNDLLTKMNLAEENKNSLTSEYEDLLKKLCEFEEINNLIFYNNLNIYAFSLFIKNLKRDQVLEFVSKKPWIEQHEIITRWAWMNVQHEEKRRHHQTKLNILSNQILNLKYQF